MQTTTRGSGKVLLLLIATLVLVVGCGGGGDLIRICELSSFRFLPSLLLRSSCLGLNDELMLGLGVGMGWVRLLVISTGQALSVGLVLAPKGDLGNQILW